MEKFREHVRIILLVLGVFFCIGGISGCKEGCNNAEETQVLVAIPKQPSQTSALIVNNGLAQALEASEAQQLVKDQLYSSMQQISWEMGDGYVMQIDEICMKYAQGHRVSGITEYAKLLGAGITICYDAYVSGDEGDYDEELLLEMISDRMGLFQKGWSAITEDACFFLERGDQYGTVLFYPKVYTINGTLSNGDLCTEVEVTYPCVNSFGFLDGIYIVFETDILDNIPE